MRVGIIGAGPAGLACALTLARANADVTVYEAEAVPGGLCRSFDLWGMRVDLGPHRFFSMDKRVTDFWMAPLQDDFVLVDRLTRIFYKQKFFSYPIRAFDALGKLGLVEATRCGLSYFAAQMATAQGEEKTFSQWVSRRFGKRLFEIFFKSYSEKLWGISCDDLDASFAAQRIKGLNLYEAIKNAITRGKKTKHKTLVEQFAYPTMGAGQPYEQIVKELQDHGGHIYYNTPVTGIEAKDGKVVGIVTPQGLEPFDYVVSTMPFTDLISTCDAFGADAKQAAAQLRYRNTILVYLLVDNKTIFQDNWIYVHAPMLKTGRITNFRNWSQAMLRGSEKSILALEYWANDEDALWAATDEELGKLAIDEMVQTGLVKKSEVQDTHVVRLHRSYPVYATGYEQHVKILQHSVESIKGLICIGRNGAFKYNNQDHSILMGLLAAETILGKGNHNLWNINTDYDYQERGNALGEDEG